MFKERHVALMGKANIYIERITSLEYAPDGKAAAALLYQIDTMIYGLSTINSSVWQGFLKKLKETKHLLRIHSKDEGLKEANYKQALAMVVETLEKYIAYMDSTLQAEPA